MLEPQYLHDMFDLLLNEAVSSNWNLSELSEKTVIDTLSNEGFDEISIKHCLSIHSLSSRVHGSDVLWTLDQRKVCIFCGTKLLKVTSKVNRSSIAIKERDGY